MHGLAETASTAAGYAFPNDLHIHWSLMIVLYPYITGIVAGAFIVSSLYHVFHVKSLQPVARFSLVFAFAFVACATLPLLNARSPAFSPAIFEQVLCVLCVLAVHFECPGGLCVLSVSLCLCGSSSGGTTRRCREWRRRRRSRRRRCSRSSGGR